MRDYLGEDVNYWKWLLGRGGRFGRSRREEVNEKVEKLKQTDR